MTDDGPHGIQLRPMTLADADDVMAVVWAAADEVDRREGRTPATPTEERRARMRKATSRFVERDPDGAWVAEADEKVVGMAEAIRRDGFWGLAMLFVSPDWQNNGIGRRLLEAACHSAEGAEVRMILTSNDPRALRLYSTSGLAIHPAVEARGTIDRTALPRDLVGREGDSSDLDLAHEVDVALRGSRADDAGFLLSIGSRMEVIDGRAGRGYAIYGDTQLQLLGATDDLTASLLLWRVLAATHGEMAIWSMTAEQNWAVKVALAARLSVAGAGPLFMSGLERPPGPWIPSGWYF